MIERLVKILIFDIMTAFRNKLFFWEKSFFFLEKNLFFFLGKNLHLILG